MSASGSRWSLASATRWKDRAKVTPASKLPADSFLLEVEEKRFIRVIYKPVIAPADSESCNRDRRTDERIIIFLFHGVGESADVWRLQISYFHQRGYDVVAPDLLGHGLSSKPSQTVSYLFENLARDVLYVFDAYKGKRNVIVGHSYGTSFCTLLAKERSSQVSKMVLISGGGPTPLKPESCSPFCFPLAIFHLIQPLIVRTYRRQAFHQPVNDQHDEKIFTLSSFVLRAVMQGQQWPEATEEYHADLIVPVLLLQGQEDKFMSIDDAQWMNETIYGSDLHVIEKAGHMLMLEQPEQVNELILAFLSRDPSTKPTISVIGAPPLSQRSLLAPVDVDIKGPSLSQKELRIDPGSPSMRNTSRPASRMSVKGSRSKILL